MNLKIIFYFILFYNCTFHSLAIEINSIQFEGLTKTKESYLRALIRSKEHEQYDSIVIKKDLFLIKSLNLFFSVDLEVKQVEDSINIVFIIREAKYLYPIFSISGFDNQLKLNVGFNQINFLGRAQNFGVIYQYYDRHSLSVFHSQKHHKNSRTGHSAYLSKYSTIEPLYFTDTVSSFNFDNYSISSELMYWFNNFIHASVGGKYMHEEYEQRDDVIDFYMAKFQFEKILVQANVEYNSIIQEEEITTGSKVRIYGENIVTQNHPEASFMKFSSQVSTYKRFRHDINIAFNTQFSIATNNESPFSPFVLDGFTNVRGVGNRIERGTAEWIVNLEYRQTLLKNTFFALQGVLFTDYGTLRQPGAKLNTFFNKPATSIFVGSGLRVHLKKWYRTNLRIDYSFNPTDLKMNGFTFGFGQFF